MKIVFAIPAYDGKLSIETHQSLDTAKYLLREIGIEYLELFFAKCCYISAARNRLVADFLKTDGTHLIFIDTDIKFSPEGIAELLQHDEDIVAGIYPLKKDEESYPVVVKTTEGGTPIGRNGLIEAVGLPTGFMKIRRSVFEKMQVEYPELEYTEEGNTVYDFFNCRLENGVWWGDDFSFCNLWRKIGGKMWVVPDITLTHIGGKHWTGNYHEYLCKLPKER